ncbi:MAG: flagellar basal body-associated FliL family protein [Terriglobales bacterium]
MADLQSSPVPTAHAAAKSSVWIYVVVVVAIGGGIFFWQHPPSAGGKGLEETVEKSTLPLDTFIVNLEGAGQRAYLRVGITLGLSHPMPRNKTEVDVPMVRDAILSVLATAQADRLLTAQGKEQLKADILRSVTEHAPQLGVENVYFTEFLVQM